MPRDVSQQIHNHHPQSLSQDYCEEIMILLCHVEIYQSNVVKNHVNKNSLRNMYYQVTFKRDILKWSFFDETYKKPDKQKKVAANEDSFQILSLKHALWL